MGVVTRSHSNMNLFRMLLTTLAKFGVVLGNRSATSAIILPEDLICCQLHQMGPTALGCLAVYPEARHKAAVTDMGRFMVGVALVGMAMVHRTMDMDQHHHLH